MPGISLHPQLEKDCHLLGRFDLCTVLLNRNATLPWFILVPDTVLEDVLDLPADHLVQVSRECQRIGRFLKNTLAMPKTNFAGLGNVVPQMHLHIIGRRIGDACWPKPVWGHLDEQCEYDLRTLTDWRDVLVAEHGLCEKE